MLSLQVWALACLALLTPSYAFLPTSLNFSDPDLSHIFCPSEMTAATSDHKAITREALRREVRRFFLENPPANTSLDIPEDATLSEMYSAYYGPTSSPTRFIRAVSSIAWSNAMAEASGQTKFQAAHHMDGERLVEGHTLLQGRYQQLIRTITVDEAYDFSRELLGTSLNGIQDFYSQSTWVELGRGGVLEGLGLPGADIGNVAGPGDATCTSCASPTGPCSGNVIPTGKLSSGYYEYSTPGADSLVVPKPVGAGKCSHGGSMDTSVMTEAIGGINKETSSPCFSPHHDLHQQATDLAILASEHYIGILRTAIGNDHFMYLLDLYHGSALSLLIDTTRSMDQEIEAVKEEARLIVERTHPELFVLVPYGDPDYGPVTKTSDEEEFLKVLDEIKVEGGLYCSEEKFWHGLQLALINTPDYSSVFCFTDAGANDAELMEGVMALATAKHCRVNIIYSYNNVREGMARYCPGSIVSGTEEYKYLATISGGLFVEIDKFDIDEVIGIMADGADENKVSICLRDDVTDHQDFSFPIDDSIFDFDIVISGIITKASITDYLGNYYDLIDKDSLGTMEDVEIISHTQNLKAVKFTKPAFGDWFFEADGTNNYSVSVTATSTLSFLSEFAQLDLNPPRPGFVMTRGRPLAGEKYYVEVTLVGYLESHVQSVSSMKFVDQSGMVLSSVPYHGMVDDHFYILSEALPSGSFYIQVDGFLETGNAFRRIHSTLAVPVECLVELVIEESVLFATPGEATEATFRVYNYGPEAEFQYIASDEEKFIFLWSPQQSKILSMGWADVEVKFMVPPLTPPGTTSTVTFTASSLLSDGSVSTYITHYLVIDKDQDTVPPTCMSTDVPDCSGYDSEYTCSGKSWTVVATLQDTHSGLLQVYSQPEEMLTLDGFTVATINPVTATFTASCCTRTAMIIGVDTRGNTGFCRWDVGSTEGTTTDPPVSTTTTDPPVSTTTTDPSVPTTTTDLPVFTTSTDLIWSTTTTTDPPHPTTSSDSTTLHITTPSSDTTITHLPPWILEFVAEEVGESWVLLRWTVSEVRNDLEKYSVLIDGDFDVDSRCPELVCHLNMTYLDPCSLHTFILTPHFKSAGGVETEGPQLHTEATTLGPVPGAPSNPSIDYVSDTTTTISWEPPANPACLHHYQVCLRKYGSLNISCDNINSNSITFNSLQPCTLYHINITSVSASGQHSDNFLQFDTNTDDAAPGAPQNLKVNNHTSNWVLLSWDEPLERASCADSWMVSYITENDTVVKKLQVMADNYATVSNLMACTPYIFFVSAVSPEGAQGSTETTRATMNETEPTAVVSVEATPLDATSVKAVWVPALEEECVHHYLVCITEFINFNESCHTTSDLEDTLTGLEACVDYEVSVTSVAPSGRFGSFVFDLTTTMDVPTSPPSNLQVTKITAHTALVSYEPPLHHPLCVTEYDIEVEKVDEISTRTLSTSGLLQQELSGLGACTDYKVRVSAVTPSGYNSGKIDINFITAEDTPSAPRSLTHKGVTPEQVQLKWFFPEVNPMCVETYRLTWTSDSGSDTMDYTFPNHPPEVMVTVGGLASCSSHTFIVTAVTPDGDQGPAASHTVSTTC